MVYLHSVTNMTSMFNLRMSLSAGNSSLIAMEMCQMYFTFAVENAVMRHTC